MKPPLLKKMTNASPVSTSLGGLVVPCLKRWLRGLSIWMGSLSLGTASFIKSLRGISNLSSPKIAIGGQQGAGKDTLIEILMRCSERQWGVVDTSDALLSIYSGRVGLTKDQILKDKQKHRKALQALGDEIEQDRLAGVLKYAFAKHALTGFEFDGVIFCSIRRPCELHYLKKNGYKIVFVEADKDIRQARRGELAGSSHSTECLDWLRPGSDYIIRNNGTHEQLEDEAIRMLHSFGL